MTAKSKENIIILALINLGVFSLIAQVLLIRELVISFYGNELFISLVLAIWLASTGIGSWCLGRILSYKSGSLPRTTMPRSLESGLIQPASAKYPNAPTVRSWVRGLLFVWHLFTPLIFFAAFILARLARIVLGSGGVMPNLIWAAGWSLLVIAPLGLFLGAQFVFLVNQFKPDKSKAVSLAYIIESFGFFLGAILFNLVLCQLTSFTVVCLLAIISFIVYLLFSFGPKFNLNISAAVAVLIILAALGLAKTDFLDKKLNGWHYPGEDLLAAANSKYGTIEITKTDKQVNFYYNGQLSDNSQNKYHNELMVHLPMLVASAPAKILIIGNAFTGLAEEVEKYKPEKIIYLELDEAYYELAHNLGFRAEAEVISQDARSYLNKMQEKFDVVIVNYSNPTTLATNRYFTKEFFSLINSHLTEEGILAVKLDTTPNYMVGAQNKLLSIFYQTLGSVYPYVYTLPDNEVIFLGTKEKLTLDWPGLEQKYSALNLDNQYVTPAFVRWRFTNDRGQKLSSQLAGSQAKVNSDFRPLLYYQQLKIFWQKMKGGVKEGTILLGVVILIMIGWLGKRFLSSNFRLLVISALPEFCLMSFEVLLVILFQAWHGYLYTQLSLIIALVLLGIALGSLIFRKLLEKIRAERLIRFSYLIITAAFFLPLLLVWQFNFVFNFTLVYWLLSILAGFAIGTKFPIINRLYLKNNTNLGAIYGIDLIGGAVGALAAGVFMLPILGVIGSLWLLVGLCVVGFIIIFFKSA